MSQRRAAYRTPANKANRPAELTDTLVYHLDALGVTGYEREYQFHKPRRWRFDLAFVALRVAVECEGGVWTGGRHTSPVGFQRDIEKYNRATMDGWRVLRYAAPMIRSGEAALEIAKFIESIK